MRILKNLSILFFIGIFYTCCTTPGQITKVEKDLAIIQQQNKQLKEEVQNFKKSSSKTNQTMTEVVDKLYKTNSNLNANILDLQTKIASLQGKIEELGRKLSKYESSEIETTYNIGGDVSKVPPDKSEEYQANQIFVSAQKDYRRGYYDLAILSFKQFLTISKDSEKLAEAQYWIGKCFYDNNKLDDAIVEYDKFIRNYPSDARIPGVMFKKATAYMRLKEPSISEPILKEIIKKYPESTEAKLAKERLAAFEVETLPPQSDN